MVCKWIRLGFVAAAVLAAGGCLAQAISVTVDGTPVAFSGVRPQMVGGRVLVPLRGVLERMGATVDWDPATRRVMAQKGDRTVILPVGFRTATVNGHPVTLDVPAQIMLGTTMVPLRFLGEALGADVKWFASMGLVEIKAGAGAPPPAATDTGATTTAPTTTTVPKITSFTHDAAGWLVTGSVLGVTMRGTAKCNASFEIPGVVAGVDMAEQSPGLYVGSWTVPDNAGSISDASLIGALRSGDQERLIQAGSPIKIDTVAPQIRNPLPEHGSNIAQNRPSISAVYDDTGGSGIQTSGVKLIVGGVNVTSKSTVTGSFINYRPSTALAADTTNVELTVTDKAGNLTTLTWAFGVTSEPDVIKSVTHDAGTTIEPGDVIHVKLNGRAGADASFSIVTAAGAKLVTRAMPETSSGVYEGEYTVRKNDDLKGAKIVGSLTTSDGETVTMEAATAIAGTPSTELAPPVVSSPAGGAKVKSPLTVKGTAIPGARVRLKVDYVTRVLGALQMKGGIAELVVDVGASGAFASEPIDLGTLAGKNTQFTLSAVTIGAAGAESAPTVVKFTRQ